jgi:hypothetical protein
MTLIIIKTEMWLIAFTTEQLTELSFARFRISNAKVSNSRSVVLTLLADVLTYWPIPRNTVILQLSPDGVNVNRLLSQVKAALRSPYRPYGEVT